MSTQPLSLDVKKIPFSQVPADIRTSEQRTAIYKVAHKLKRMDDGTALRVKLDGLDAHEIQKCVHAHFRSATKRVRTRQKEGYIYLWLEKKDIVRFERTKRP